MPPPAEPQPSASVATSAASATSFFIRSPPAGGDRRGACRCAFSEECEGGEEDERAGDDEKVEHSDRFFTQDVACVIPEAVESARHHLFRGGLGRGRELESDLGVGALADEALLARLRSRRVTRFFVAGRDVRWRCGRPAGRGPGLEVGYRDVLREDHSEAGEAARSPFGGSPPGGGARAANFHSRRPSHSRRWRRSRRAGVWCGRRSVLRWTSP